MQEKTTISKKSAYARKYTRSLHRKKRLGRKPSRIPHKCRPSEKKKDRKIDRYAWVAGLSGIGVFVFAYLFPPLVFFLFLSGLGFGIFSLVRIKKNRDKLRGKGLAILGVAVGGAIVLLTAITIVVLAAYGF